MIIVRRKMNKEWQQLCDQHNFTLMSSRLVLNTVRDQEVFNMYRIS